jgi:predicted nuclease of predicted toxin-antitoxin system
VKLYLDDDNVATLLVRLLKRAGHDTELPRDAGLEGQSDPVHLERAITTDRTLLSGNHDDFEELHDLIRAAGGTHSGILIVRRDNDRRRDLTPRGIVTAIAHLLDAGVLVESEFIVLNHWR